MKWIIVAALALSSCSSSSGVGSSSSATGGIGGSTTSGTSTSSSSSGSGSTSTGSGSTSTSSSTGSSGSTGGAPTAAQLLALTQSCTQASNGLYKTDSDSASATVAICKLNGAFFWQADMDVDCDGKTTTQCNINTDPAYQNDTSLHDNSDQPLDAANLPYVVIPLPSTRFDYTAAANQLALGDVVAVIYNNQVNYGVFGDEGPSDIIGEASYAMASSLGGRSGPVVWWDGHGGDVHRVPELGARESGGSCCGGAARAAARGAIDTKQLRMSIRREAACLSTNL